MLFYETRQINDKSSHFTPISVVPWSREANFYQLWNCLEDYFYTMVAEMDRNAVINFVDCVMLWNVIYIPQHPTDFISIFSD